MMIKPLTRFTSLLLILSLTLLQSGKPVWAYGELDIANEISTADETVRQPAFQSWLNNWQGKASTDTGKIVLTPGSTENDLNFAWYSQTIGTPAVVVSSDRGFARYKVFSGKADAITRSNGSTTYTAANHVSATDYFRENTTYYYRYTSDIDAAAVEWSETGTYTTKTASSFSAILVGDAQIGASGNVAADTYNWNQTLQQAEKSAPNASFLLSAGDQIDYKTDSGDSGLRESQYAGFLFPSILRSLPVATVIGNHETKGSDYKFHFNNPNNGSNYGSTPSGCDYYFSYGDALFIILNSNSRNLTAHRKLMKQATQAHPQARWRIVLFHHDIYGSGVFHSNRTSANMRVLFAPLMDEFQVDIVFSGHDHSYARSYSMLDGTAIDSDSNTLTNPVGTTYITLGTSTGSKMYGLAYPKQFYVAERSNNSVPTYSILTISSETLKLQTYDNKGKEYADTFTIRKTKTKTDPLSAITKAKTKKKSNYTKSSMQQLNKALSAFQNLFQETAADIGAAKIEKYFRKANDPLSYYGYAAGTTEALPAGFSTLLDKTRNSCKKISSSRFASAVKSVRTATTNLKKTTLTVKKGKKKLKNNATVQLKKGHKLKLSVSKSPSKYKVTYSSAKKKYVTVNKKGIIKAVRKRKKPTQITIRFQNRVFHLKIRTI